MTPVAEALDLAEQIELACLMEACARKPGNVHPGAAFIDLEFEDFARAAAACAEPLSRVKEIGLGTAILEAVRATKRDCRSNVNLGICLLLAPIAGASDPKTLRQEVAALVEGSTLADAEAVYEAIRLAQPGGMGQANQQDVAEVPTVSLVEAMRMAAERDTIAELWSTGFRRLDRDAVMVLKEHWDQAHRSSLPCADDECSVPWAPWERAIITTHLELLADGDTLIRRKCGPDVEQQGREMAQAALTAGACETETGRTLIARLDDWLRADGHRRNPGTSADMMAAALLWNIRKGWIVPPTKDEVFAHAAAIRRSSI